MGANTLKCYSSLKSLLKPFKLFLKFLLWSSQKYCFGFFNFWVFDFSGLFFGFVNMGPYRSQNFKTLLLPQITFESFQTFSEFSSQWSSRKYCFEFLIFQNFSFVFINMGPYGSQNFKTLLPHKPLLNLSKLILNCLLSGSHKCTLLDFWNFKLMIFNVFFTKI